MENAKNITQIIIETINTILQIQILFLILFLKKY